jgi:hypothetical protein
MKRIYSFLLKPQSPKVEVKILKESKVSIGDSKIKDSSNVNNLLEYKEEPFVKVDEIEDEDFKYKEESTWEITSK